MDRHLLFKCPITGFCVQHRVRVEDTQDDAYESVACAACTRIHFVHRETGKVLGEK